MCRRTSNRQKIALVIFGLFLCVVFLEIGMRIGGFILLLKKEYTNKKPMKQKGDYRIMCLGESTTEGEGVTISYPSQLENILNQRDMGLKFEVINKGRSAVTTTGIVANLESYIEEYNPDMIITMMGINDTEDTVGLEDASFQDFFLFYRKFRTYKLIKFLNMHILHKLEEKRLGIPKIEQKILSITDNINQTKEYIRYEGELKTALKVNPEDHEVFEDLVMFYYYSGELNKADNLINRILETNLTNSNIYVFLSMFYTYMVKSDRAVKMLNNAMELDPENYLIYIGFAELYRLKGNPDKVKKMLKKAAFEINSKEYPEYLKLVEGYDRFSYLNFFGKSTAMLHKAHLKKHPEDYNTYLELGRYYRFDHYPEDSEKMYKKSIALNPNRNIAYARLGALYRYNGKYDLSEKMLRKAIEINPLDKESYFHLVTVLYLKSSEKILQKGNKVIHKGYYPVTIMNYRRLKKIVVRKGIKLVIVQYPNLSIEPLKSFFKDKDDIFFVSNERVFSEAITKGSFDEYFTDRFGKLDSRSSGHCTVKGYALLAENIANSIIGVLGK